ncbi:MAG TPA: glycosyltransferase family 9 protein [Verrucomicrobiae bacterium]|nr:glycosyltransferase family 9 protein [Verrucomicrobiae bacterium]
MSKLRDRGFARAGVLKPKLLIVELWGLGDLVIATPFLRAAAAQFEVTLLAKSYALDLQRRLWPGVRVVPFVAPWTAFENKYRIWRWPLREIIGLRGQLAAAHFDAGISARWDPRDHLSLYLFGVKRRIGFPRMHSGIFLTDALARPSPDAHRYESWRAIARALKMELPPREQILIPVAARNGETVLIHSGAAQMVRVWPLECYQGLAGHLRQSGFLVQIACDTVQRDWWLRAGEKNVATPATVGELIELTDRAAAFIGNDSGPGHLAAFCGVPTFTLFGPQLPEWFAPLHPRAEWIGGKACPYLPCSDYCRFPEPFCIRKISEEEAVARIEKFLAVQRIKPAAR